MADHGCPHPRCGRTIPGYLFACRPHWFTLPVDIRNRIRDAWRAGDVRAHTAAMLDAAAFWEETVTND